MRKNITWSSIILACIIGFFLMSCAASSKITMTQEKYSPSFRAGDYSRVKGKKLILSSFYNQAQNTKAGSYNSADNKYMYECNATLENYYWGCFRKAFKHIGVNLVDYTYGGGPRPYHHGYWWGHAPPSEAARAARGVPEFQLILTSMTDQEFRFKVLLFKNGETKLDKDFTVKMAPAGTDNVGELEKRSYRLVDLAFTTIMKDRDFQRVF